MQSQITIDEPDDFGEIVARDVVLRGSAPAGSRLEILDWTDVVGGAEADAEGRWSITLHRVDPGDHIFVARIRGSGLTEASVTCSVWEPEVPAAERNPRLSGFLRRKQRTIVPHPDSSSDSSIEIVAGQDTAGRQITFRMPANLAQTLIVEHAGTAFPIPVARLSQVAAVLRSLNWGSESGEIDHVIHLGDGLVRIEPRVDQGHRACIIQATSPESQLEIQIASYVVPVFVRAIENVLDQVGSRAGISFTPPC